jgi:hypothetical protein
VTDFYIRENGEFTDDPIKNIRLTLSNKEAMLKVIHRLMKIPTVG